MIEGEFAAPSPGGLADEVAAVLADRRDPGVETFERVLNAVVSHAYRDREAVTAALRSVPREVTVMSHSQVRSVAGIVGAAVGPVRADESWENAGAGWLELCRHAALDYVAGARLVELGARLRAGDPVPFLLSVPSRPTGAVEPHELVARLAEYGRLGVRPGPADLGQALLRCGGPIEPEVVRAAEKLELEEGPRVAAWLRQGGLPPPAWWRERESGEPERPSKRRGARTGRRILVGHEAVEGRGAFPRRFWSLFRTFEPHIGCPHASLPDGRDAHTVATLPWHPEIAAARLLTGVASAADQDGPGAPVFLEALAAAEGPAGPAVHLAVAYGLASGRERDREAAARALVLLASRGRLDGELLGRETTELVGLGTLKVPLLTESLRAAAALPQGAAAVWAVLAPALPGLLACTRPQAHGALLAVAADSARLSGAHGELPEVTALAQRPGSSQLLKQARRLRDTLAVR
ncbi:hypothetical protein [Streptomyces sp. NBC_01294]|uniref:hypothetical protein n=1 Tax=Streptomyces sp. NBC_01294 TaxID=2903815 RepID=UPI002DDA0A30|nr:hypothetical protein [Streptomyces sp. NBC_01294]WRZ55372.1 hypothetical protein OG534_02050 [Streptomyces sp. NBC_01294]WRZ61324.1 hypothetical protein OG534_35450 [Streptomyces sp. NBC_01294]